MFGGDTPTEETTMTEALVKTTTRGPFGRNGSG